MMNGVNGMGDSQTAQLLTQQGVMQSNLVQICKYQGPVVQSMVSLTTSFRHQIVKYMLTTFNIKYAIIFLLENKK